MKGLRAYGSESFFDITTELRNGNSERDHWTEKAPEAYNQTIEEHSTERKVYYMKKLAKDKNNAFFTGVCAGVARYFDLDPTVVRVGWAIGTVVLGGTGIIAYLAAMFLMPEDGENDIIDM